MARHYLVVPGPADPRYDDLLRGFMVTAHPDFRALRAALFTRCEQEESEDADTARLAAALEQLSVGYPLTPACRRAIGIAIAAA